MKLYSIIPTLPVYVYNLHNISVAIQIMFNDLIKQKKTNYLNRPRYIDGIVRIHK